MTTSKDETDEIRKKKVRDRSRIRYLCPIYKHKSKQYEKRRWKNTTPHKKKLKSLRKKIDYHKKIAMSTTATEKQRNNANIKWTAAMEEKEIYLDQYSIELLENRVDDTDETTDTMMCDVDVSDGGRNEHDIDDDYNVINNDDSNINSNDKDADISDVYIVDVTNNDTILFDGTVALGDAVNVVRNKDDNEKKVDTGQTTTTTPEFIPCVDNSSNALLVVATNSTSTSSTTAVAAAVATVVVADPTVTNVNLFGNINLVAPSSTTTTTTTTTSFGGGGGTGTGFPFDVAHAGICGNVGGSNSKQNACSNDTIVMGDVVVIDLVEDDNEDEIQPQGLVSIEIEIETDQNNKDQKGTSREEAIYVEEEGSANENIVELLDEIIDTDGNKEKIRDINNDEDANDDEVKFIGSNGKNALCDYPHSRADCVTHLFSTNPLRFCPQCYCFVCDVKAIQCTTWDCHCQAQRSDIKWRQRRSSVRSKRKAPERMAKQLSCWNSNTVVVGKRVRRTIPTES